MTPEQFNRERDYLAMLALIRTMLRLGMIDAQDFTLLRGKLLEQYQPALSCLLLENEPP
ncbi:MAG: hypothetical protein LBJ11_05530 [Oscillospiraceae bacterium]|nr:hypothetical protein [Oscillospiraceae bacterium]